MVEKNNIVFEISVAEAEMLLNKLGELQGKQCFNEMLFLSNKATEAMDNYQRAKKETNPIFKKGAE